MQSAAFAGGSKVRALQGALSPAPRRFHSLRMSAQATSPICSDTKGIWRGDRFDSATVSSANAFHGNIKG
jgi:hypothetical protein